MIQREIKELEIKFQDMNELLKYPNGDVIFKLKITGLKKEDVEWNRETDSIKLSDMLRSIGSYRDFLFDLSETKLPDDLTDMTFCFVYCKPLFKSPSIPLGVKNMAETFRGCENLVEAPVIPEKVEYMWGTFMDCKSLKEAPVIPEGAWRVEDVYRGCTRMENQELEYKQLKQRIEVSNASRMFV